jgi:uncharacterized membrane protein
MQPEVLTQILTLLTLLLQRAIKFVRFLPVQAGVLYVLFIQIIHPATIEVTYQ